MQELGKFSPKTIVIPNRLEKYMSFTTTGSFISKFYIILSSSLDGLVRNLGKG